ncbi:MAG: hypothetical protein ABSG04_04465 [Verrucomicrobiota bacterium]
MRLVAEGPERVSEIVVQVPESARRALEIAAAGGQRVLMLHPITLQLKSEPNYG